MDTGTTIRTARYSPTRLRASRGGAAATVVLVLLLAIALIEPLVCVTYCRNMALLGLRGPLAPPYQNQGILPGTSSVTADGVTPTLVNLCRYSTDPTPAAPSGAPSTPALAFAHEHLAASVVIMLVVLTFLIQHERSVPPRLPAQHAVSPLLRPPIARIR